MSIVNTSINNSKRRVTLIFCVILYILAFLTSYEAWVVPGYESWGMSYQNIPIFYSITSWIFCILIAALIPLDLKRPTNLLLYIQYIVIFVPASFVIYHSSRPELNPDEVFELVLSMFFGLVIIILSYKIPLLSFMRLSLSPRRFYHLFWFGFVFLVGYTVSVYGSHFSLADFQEIYNVRAASDEIVKSAGSGFVGYAQMWLAGVFLPFLFSIGLFKKRWGLVLVAISGYVYLTGILGTKSTMFAIFYLYGIYILVKNGGSNCPAKISLFFGFVLMVPIFLDLLADFAETTKIWYVAIIHARTFTIPQLSIGQYYYFFDNNPWTFGSQISGLSLFADYPYDKDIPRLIGWYFYNTEITANVNMWAQDGITSLGLLGIPLVSVIASVIFWLFDSVVKNTDYRLVTVAMGNIALIFANGSLFTTLLSGGMAILALVFYFYPTRNDLATS